MSELFSKVALCSIIDFIKEPLDFIVTFKCMFLTELQLFSLKFLSFAYYYCLFIISTSTLFLYVEHVSLKSFNNNSFLICLLCFISTIVGTNSLNSADMQLTYEQTATQSG